MSTSGSESAAAKPLHARTLAFKLLCGAVLIVVLNHAMAFAARSTGMGDAFKDACAQLGFERAMARGATTLVVGASDAVAIDPNLLGQPAASIVLRSAGFETILLAMEFITQRNPQAEQLIMVINPLSFVTTHHDGLQRLSGRFGQEFDTWLYKRDPTQWYGYVLAQHLKADIWQDTLKSTRDLDIGNARARCEQIAAQHGLQVANVVSEETADAAAAEAMKHSRMRADNPAQEAQTLEHNLAALRSFINAAQTRGITVSVVLPPLHSAYRQVLNIEAIVAEAARHDIQVHDLTSAFDDLPDYYLNANHIDWPEGSKLATAMFLNMDPL